MRGWRCCHRAPATRDCESKCRHDRPKKNVESIGAAMLRRQNRREGLGWGRIAVGIHGLSILEFAEDDARVDVAEAEAGFGNDSELR